MRSRICKKTILKSWNVLTVIWNNLASILLRLYTSFRSSFTLYPTAYNILSEYKDLFTRQTTYIK
jgi:hypothetical protein